MQVTTSEGDREWLVLDQMPCSTAVEWEYNLLVDDR